MERIVTGIDYFSRAVRAECGSGSTETGAAEAEGLLSCKNGTHHPSPAGTALSSTTSFGDLLESGLQWVADNGSLPSPTPESDPSDDPYQSFLVGSRFWVQRVLVPSIMIIGVIGNTMTIVIMTRRRMRSSTNNYLAALAIFDMLYLIIIFYLSFAHYPTFKDPKYYYYWKLWPFSLMLTDACSNSSVWLTVCFTIERFIVVSHPIQGKAMCTESRSRKVILCVFLFCFTYTLPTPFEWLIVEKIDPETNNTILTPFPSDLGQNTIYKSIYSWLTAVIFVFAPLLLLAIFNSFLIRSVHISRKERSQMTQSKIQATFHSKKTANSSTIGTKASTKSGDGASSSKQENKITVMLIAVVILFFLCQLPTAIMLLYTSIHDPAEGTKEFYLIRGLSNIFNFLVAINAACNFVLYCLLSQRYRRTFVNVFCPCLKDKLGYFQTAYHQTVYSKVKGRAAPGEEGETEMKNLNPTALKSSATPSPNSKRMAGGQHFEARKLLNFDPTPCSVESSALTPTPSPTPTITPTFTPTPTPVPASGHEEARAYLSKSPPKAITSNSDSNYCDNDVEGNAGVTSKVECEVTTNGASGSGLRKEEKPKVAALKVDTNDVGDDGD